MDYLSSNVSNDAFHAVNIQLLWPKFSHDEKNPLNGDKSVIFKKENWFCCLFYFFALFTLGCISSMKA